MRFFLVTLLMCWSWLAVAAQNATVVDNVRANVRSGKSDAYRVVTVLTPGTQVEILQVEDGYAQIKVADGQEGWVVSRLLKIDKPEADPVAPVQNLCDEKLAAAKLQLQEEQRRLAKTQIEVKRLQALQSGQGSVIAWVAAVCLVVGLFLGFVLRERHYRKRLQGLRI